MVEHRAHNYEKEGLYPDHVVRMNSPLKGVITRSIVDVLSELCSPFLKGGNSAFIPAIASGLFPQTEYRSLE